MGLKWIKYVGLRDITEAMVNQMERTMEYDRKIGFK